MKNVSDLVSFDPRQQVFNQALDQTKSQVRVQIVNQVWAQVENQISAVVNQISLVAGDGLRWWSGG
jgi:hypothetical protein